MAQNSKDYKNGKIYCIRNTINDEIYVGSTTQPLSKRMAKHRQNAKCENKMHRIFYSKVNEIGIEHFYIELIEDCPCDTLEQLRKREGLYIRKIGTLNHKIECRTRHEYNKEYYEANKDKILEQKKEKMICACGSMHTLHHKSRHERTQKHQQYIQQCNV